MVLGPGGLYTLLANLRDELEHAYRAEEPNREFFDRIYEFAAWCFGARQNPYVRNAIAVSFYEHVPAFGPARGDLVERFTAQMWSELQPLLHRMLPPHDYDAFAAEIRAHGHDRGTHASSRRT